MSDGVNERLLAVEKALGRLTERIDITLKYVVADVEKHDVILEGRNGTPGLKSDVAIIKDTEKRRAAYLLATITGVIGLVLDRFFHLVGK